MRINFLIVSLIFLSCNNGADTHKVVPVSNDTSNVAVKDTSSSFVNADTSSMTNQGKSDTTIKYDLENVSSEGAEANACYFEKQIFKAKIIIYGASGRVEVSYNFTNGLIKAEERTYKYLKALSEVKSEKDIKLESTAKYTLSNSGKVVEGKSTDAEEIYKSFIETVPLKLK